MSALPLPFPETPISRARALLSERKKSSERLATVLAVIIDATARAGGPVQISAAEGARLAHLRGGGKPAETWRQLRRVLEALGLVTVLSGDARRNEASLVDVPAGIREGVSLAAAPIPPDAPPDCREVIPPDAPPDGRSTDGWDGMDVSNSSPKPNQTDPSRRDRAREAGEASGGMGPPPPSIVVILRHEGLEGLGRMGEAIAAAAIASSRSSEPPASLPTLPVRELAVGSSSGETRVPFPRLARPWSARDSREAARVEELARGLLEADARAGKANWDIEHELADLRRFELLNVRTAVNDTRLKVARAFPFTKGASYMLVARAKSTGRLEPEATRSLEEVEQVLAGIERGKRAREQQEAAAETAVAKVLAEQRESLKAPPVDYRQRYVRNGTSG